MKILGILLMISGIVIGFIETSHFGNNLLPKTKEELIWDIIALMIFISGVIVFKKK